MRSTLNLSGYPIFRFECETADPIVDLKIKNASTLYDSLKNRELTTVNGYGLIFTAPFG